MRLKERNKRLTVGRAACRIAKRIQMKRTFVQNAKLVKNASATANDLSISNPITRPQIFNPNLVKLSHAAFLWPFITEHGASIEKLQGQALRQTIGNHRPDNASSILWA